MTDGRLTKATSGRDTILLAALDCSPKAGDEFTEWDLAVAAWKRDPKRFGLRGYAALHPDHKRVAMEIMGKRPLSPIGLGLLEKVRKNTYRLTPLGRAMAVRIRDGSAHGLPNTPLTVGHYDVISDLMSQAAFVRWHNDPDQPRDKATFVAFLGGRPAAQVEAMVRAAMAWCDQRDVAYLTKHPAGVYQPIHYSTLAELLDFLTAMRFRFPKLAEAS